MQAVCSFDFLAEKKSDGSFRELILIALLFGIDFSSSGSETILYLLLFCLF